MNSQKREMPGGTRLIILLMWFWIAASASGAGLVAAWGNNNYGQTTIPSGLGPIKAVAGGGAFNVALKGDGTVAVWGNPYYIAILPVAGLNNIKAISAGNLHMVALKADGIVVAMGENSNGQTNVPAGLSGVVAVAGGEYHNLALRYDGTVVAWGNNDHGQTNVPPILSNVVALAAGFEHSLALKADGTVVAWGDNTYGQTSVPDGLSNVVAVAAGHYHSLALRGDGTVMAWGGLSAQTNVPAGLSNVVAIAAGYDRSMVLKSDGTVIMWGDNTSGQSNVPAGLVATAIAVGAFHNLALVSEGPAQIIQDLQSQMVSYSSNATLSVSVTGYQPISFLWKYNGSPLVETAHVYGRTNSTLTINNLQFSDTGNYSVVVSNALGSVTSSNAVLTVISPPLILQQSSGQTLRAGSDLTLSASVIGSPTLNYQWLFGGSNILGATRSSLALTNVQLSMSGDYVLTISNIYGVAQSAPISLMITDSVPYVLQQPTNKSVALGGSVTFSINARGSTPLSYQWRFSGEDIPGATNAILTLGPLSYGQSGYYNVVVGNAFGEVISVKAFLNVTETVIWGDNRYFAIPTNMPPGLTNLVAISGGPTHILGLKADGTVATWSDNSECGLTNIPPGLTNVVAVSAGNLFSMALKADGRVVAWGSNSSGQTNVPASLTNASGIAAGGTHCVALKSNGTVAAWGGNSNGQTNVPTGLTNVVAVAAGTYSSMALRVDGTVVVWGGTGESRLPAGLTNVVAIAGGQGTCVALKADGTVIEWGSQSSSNPAAKLTNVVAITAAGVTGIALQKDGTIATWGQIFNFPTGLTNVFAIANGGFETGFYAALVGDGLPIVKVQPFTQTIVRGTNVQLTALAVGMQPMSYQWQHDGAIIQGATQPSLVLTNVQGNDVGGYRMVVSNGLGQTNSTTAFLSMPNPSSLAIAVNSTNLFSASGPTNGLWFPQIRVSHDGDGAAQSGAITNNQQSLLELNVTGPGTLTFWWKVSSEEGFDFLKLSMDVALQSTVAAISGEVDWEQRTVAIPAGQRSLFWVYSKDGSVSDGQDAGWLDQVVFTPDPVTITQQPVSQTVVLGTNVTFSVQATSTVALAYQWLKNGTNLFGSTQTSLTLTNVAQTDAGVYAVKVSNGGTGVLSSNAVLTVTTPQVLGSPSVMPDGSMALTSRYFNGAMPDSNALTGFQLQASSDLVTWITLTNSPVLTNGALRFVEPNSTSYVRRFYRVVERR